MRIYVAFDALSYDDLRAQILLPPGLKGTFSTPAVQKAYLDLVTRIARDFKPDFFVPMVEIDLHARKSPHGYQAFKQLYPQAYRLIKAASPTTLVAPSITYGDYDGKNGIDPGDRKTFAGFVADFDNHSDMLAVSTYPLCFLTPKVIPREFFWDMCAASTKPLFISETSWPSETFEIAIPNGRYKFKTSEADQAMYVEKMRQSTEYLRERRRQILAVNLVSLTDPSPITRFAANLIHHQFNWFCSLALADNDGKPKPAFTALRNWRALPLR